MHKPIAGWTGFALAGLFAAACGGTPAVSGLPTLPPVTLPPLPTVPAVPPDTALEDLFPDTVGGNTLAVTSVAGEGVITQFGNRDPEGLRAVFQRLGANIDQVSAAISFNLWPGATAGDLTGLTISALRVQGVPASRTLAELTELTKQGFENAQVSTATIGGKSVTSIGDPAEPDETVYLYGWNDVVFLGGGTPAHVEEAFSKLP